MLPQSLLPELLLVKQIPNFDTALESKGLPTKAVHGGSQAPTEVSHEGCLMELGSQILTYFRHVEQDQGLSLQGTFSYPHQLLPKGKMFSGRQTPVILKVLQDNYFPKH